MSPQQPSNKPSKAALYFRAMRPFAYPASVIPVLVGAALALGEAGRVRWDLLPLVLLGGVLFHSATNLVSEYFDLRKGVDRRETYGSSRVLVEGLLPPRNVLIAGLLAFAGGFAVGLVLMYFRGLTLLWLGLAGLAGGYFYTGRPIAYKYLGLGDLGVFILMGPLMVMGSYFVLVGRFTWACLLVSLPVGSLVAAILCGNNVRDIADDAKARIRTLENLLGLSGAKALYCCLVAGGYVSVAAMVLAGVLSPWALLVFLAAWLAWRNVRTILGAKLGRAADIAVIDVKTAQHHLLFGALLCAGMTLAAVL